MSAHRILPHTCVPAALWQATPWSAQLNGVDRLVGDWIEDWDYQTPVAFTYSLDIDRTTALEAAGLGSDCQVAAFAIVDCQATYYRAQATVPLTDGSGLVVKVEAPAGQLAAGVRLRRGLVLARPGTATGRPRAANAAGALLFEDAHQFVDLEGGGSRFPTEAASLGDARCNVAWRLSIAGGSDPEDPFAAVVRLIMNTDHPAARRLLAAPATAAERRERALLMSALRTDVIRQLLAHAATEPRFSQQLSFPEDSLGGVASEMAGTYLGLPLRAAVTLLAEQPTEFEVRLKSGTRFLGEPGSQGA